MTTLTATDPTVLYWEKLAAYLRHAFSLFGDPSTLARRVWLSRAEHKQMCAFLRPLEAIARRLIFIAALELAPMTHPPSPERKFRAHRAMPTNTGAPFDVDKPETWRVSFSLGAPARRRQSATPPAQRSASAAFGAGRVSAAPSAARLEALVRAFNNPDRHAAALARTIARNAAAAHAFTARPHSKHAHKTGHITLHALIPLCVEAYQRFVHRKLDAVRPDSS